MVYPSSDEEDHSLKNKVSNLSLSQCEIKEMDWRYLKKTEYFEIQIQNSNKYAPKYWHDCGLGYIWSD